MKYQISEKNGLGNSKFVLVLLLMLPIAIIVINTIDVLNGTASFYQNSLLFSFFCLIGKSLINEFYGKATVGLLNKSVKVIEYLALITIFIMFDYHSGDGITRSEIIVTYLMLTCMIIGNLSYWKMLKNKQ